MVIPDHYKTDAHCDTERDKQCVQHADRTGNIVLVSDIADAIRKRHTGDQWDDGTDDNLTQMMSKSQLIDQDAMKVTNMPPDIFVAILESCPFTTHSR